MRALSTAFLLTAALSLPAFGQDTQPSPTLQQRPDSQRQQDPQWGASGPIASPNNSPTAYSNPYQIPDGTTFIVRLDNTLDSKNTSQGHKFTAQLAEDLITPNGTLIPHGKKLYGHVSDVSNGFRGRMLLSFTDIETAHGKAPLIATVLGVPGEHAVQTSDNEGEIEKHTDKRRAVESAVIGAAIGGTAGALGGGGKGAGIGVAAGAALGGTTGILTGRDLRLVKGTQLELRLDRPLTVPRN